MTDLEFFLPLLYPDYLHLVLSSTASEAIIRLKGDIVERIPQPHELKALDPDEFAEIFETALKAASGRYASPNPEHLGVNLQEDSGSVTEIRFRDHPMNRLGLTVKRKAKDSETFWNVMFRIFGFMNAIHDPEVRELIMKKEGDLEDYLQVHPAMLDAAATCPMDGEGNFEINTLLGLIRNLKQEKYPYLR